MRHVQHAPRGEVPFAAEVTLGSRIGVRRDHRNEQRAVVDLLLDLRIPGVAPAQGVLVEPDVDARGPQGLADALGCLRMSSEP